MFGAGDDALVVALILGNDAGGAEAVLGGFAGGDGHGFQADLVAEQRDGGCRHGVDIADIAEDASEVVVDKLRDPADACGDCWDATGHGFECGQPEGLHLAGHEHEVGEGEELVDVVLLADKVDAVLNTVAAGEIFGSGAIGAVADEEQAGGHGFGDAGEDLDDIVDALDGAEVGEMDEKLFRWLGSCRWVGVARSHGSNQLRFADIVVAVDEVVDDFDLRRDGEGLASAVAEMA